MSKTNKELAVDIAIAYIHSHQKKLKVASNNAFKESSMISVDVVNNIIESTYKTLEQLESSSK